MPKEKQVKAAALVTIPNVPIVSTGTYHLASGITTFTEEHLRAAIAAQDDPAVTAPRLKIGHMSDFGDGEPCFGKVLNMYLGDNDQTIYGDYVGVPVWLAELMPTAYPARSIEGAFDAQVAEDKPPHALLITAVSLLGVVAPGVSTLEDLPDLYGEEAPEGLEIIATTNLVAGVKIIAKAVGGDMPKDKITAAVSVDDVRREYYDSLDSAQSWWWICRVEVDPMQLIVDDEEGSLYRVTYDPGGDEITFGDPIEVEIVYVDVDGGSTTARAVPSEGKVLATYKDRDASRPNDEEGGGDVPKPKAKSKKDQAKAKALRASLGLKEDATDQEVAAALKEAKDLLASEEESEDEESEDEDEEEEEESEEDEESDEDEEDEEDEDEEPVAGSDGTVKMDKASAAKLKQDAELGRKAYAKQQKEERESFLTAAVKAGKFPRARKEHWRKLWKKDPEGTKASIEELESGLVPVDDVDDADAGGDELTASAYDQSWLSPGERARIEAAHAEAGSGTITQEAPVK